jgi:predicted site-specific integrase-resolvase
MKLSEYAKKLGVHYVTALRYWKAGKVKGFKTHTGTIIVTEDFGDTFKPLKIVLYARVSSSENKINLDTQMERLKNYASAKGYKVFKEIKEIGSGINDARTKLESVLKDREINLIIVEHKDRLTRFGFNFLEVLLKNSNRKIEVINNTDSEKEDLIQDFISIITSFCARIYGQRRCKRKTEKIIQELKEEKDKNASDL